MTDSQPQSSMPITRKRRQVRLVLLVLGFVGLVAAVGGVSFGLLMSRKGGLDAAWLGGWVERALAERLGPNAVVTIEGFNVGRGDNGFAQLDIQNLSVRDPSGRVLVSAPEAQVALDSMLPYPGAAITRVDLVNIALALQIETDGSVVIAANAPASVPTPPAKEQEPPAYSPQLLAQRFGSWIDELEKSGLDGVSLSGIGVRNGTLTLDDKRYNMRLTMSGIDLGVEVPKAGGVIMRIVGAHGGQRWRATLTGSPRQMGRRTIDFTIADIALADTLPVLIGYDDYVIDLMASAQGQFMLGDNGVLLGMNARLSTSSGRIGPQGGAMTVIDTMFAELEMTAGNAAIAVRQAEFIAGDDQIKARGEILPLANGTIRFDLQQAMLSGRWLDRHGPPFTIAAISGSGHILPAEKAVAIDRLLFGSGLGEQVALEGRLMLEPKGLALDVGIAASSMPVALALRYWPEHISPHVREWAKANMRDGLLDRLTLSARIPAGGLEPDVQLVLEPNDLHIEAALSGAAFLPAPGLPPIRDAKAQVMVDGRSVQITIPAATLDSGTAPIALSGGSVFIEDHAAHPPVAAVNFQFRGPVGALSELLSREPLRDVAAVSQLKPGANGAIDARTSLRLPLKASLSIADVDYRIDGKVTDFSQKNIVGTMALEGGNFTLGLSREETQVMGEARIGGAPARIDLRLPRSGASLVRVQAVLNDTARKALGFDLAPRLTGPVGVRINTQQKEGASRHDVDLDLTGATITDLIPGWGKSAGQSGKASFNATERADGGWKIDDIALSSRNVAIKGAATLDGDGELVSATFPTFALSDGDKTQLKLERAGDMLNVALRGDVFDGRTLLKALTGPVRGRIRQTATKQPDIAVDVKLDAVAGHRGEIIRKLDLKAMRRNDELQSLRASGRIGRDEPFLAEITGRARRTLRLAAGDAGAWLRFVDLYPSMIGGDIDISMTPPDTSGTVRNGALEITSFRIRGDAAIGGLAASATGAESDRSKSLEERTRNLRSRAEQGGGEIAFSRLAANFERMQGRVLISNGVLQGGNMGATVEGEFDSARNRIRLAGTYIPAYALNNMLARIPLVGVILGGSPEEGLIGVNFEIEGPLGQPQLRINPASVVTPGIFRRILDFRNRKGGPSAENVSTGGGD